MARPHIPNMNDIKSLPNEEIRFYALAGAIMSLAAGLELAYVDLFECAAKINRDIDVSSFYPNLKAFKRRDKTNAAVLGALAGTPLLAEWTTLFDRIEKLTGRDSQRNLLAHTVIQRKELEKQGPIMPSGFLGLTEMTIKYHVEQDAARLLAGLHKPSTADFNSLFAYCEEIIAVLDDLDEFLGKLV